MLCTSASMQRWKMFALYAYIVVRAPSWHLHTRQRIVSNANHCRFRFSEYLNLLKIDTVKTTRKYRERARERVCAAEVAAFSVPIISGILDTRKGTTSRSARRDTEKERENVPTALLHNHKLALHAWVTYAKQMLF